MMSEDDNDGQMIVGDLVGLKLPDICLTGEEKTPPRKPVPTGDRTRARCVTGAHAAALPTTVDHVTLVYPIYPPLFVFQPEHSLEASCLLTLLV